MVPSDKQVKRSISETGQIPRELLEAYQKQAEVQGREGEEEQETGSITGIFRMEKRADGNDNSKERQDTPKAGSAAEPVSPAKQ
jgi:hypothetical protein